VSDLTPDQLARLQAAHSAFDRDHAAERDKLLAALPATPPAVPLSLWHRGRQMVRHNWTKGMAAAVLAVAAFGLWQVVQPPTAFGQVAKAMQAAGGYSFDGYEVTTADGKDTFTRVGRMVFSPAGDMRAETYIGGKLASYDINRVGKPGVSVDHTRKTFHTTAADRTASPFLTALGGLAKYTGAADDDLGTKAIGGVKAKGYLLSLNKLVPDAGDESTLDVWIDPATSRPVRIDLRAHGQRMRFENFTWGNLAATEFDTTPPAGYTDVTPKPPTAEEITDKIVLGLKTYHKYAGKYPPGKKVYGDTTRDELFAAAGFLHSPGRPAKTDEERAESMTDKWLECSNASNGFSWMNQLQRKNPDAAYHGKTVTAVDAGKVLFRWKLDDGGYRVIFADLSSETVPAERLKVLEK
jgi:outer membrane lipoprotein-sorting protein